MEIKKQDMILNNMYKRFPNGIIKQQDNKITMDYGNEYILNNYCSPIPKETLTKMAGLRLGYLLGSIGKDIGSILDFGYGGGDFLDTCVEKGLDSYGIDVPGVSLPKGCKEGSLDNYYDAICFFDSLEHMQDIDFVKNLKCTYICIAVPWCHFCSKEELGEEWFSQWKHRKYGEHLWHFDDISLENFLNECGFEVINKSNIEDTIRKNSGSFENILTVIARRK